MNTDKDFNALTAGQRAPNDQASGLEKVGSWFTAVRGMSLWLTAWIFGTFFAYLGILFLLWRHAHGGTFTQVLYGLGMDHSRKWKAVEILAGLPFDVWLLWFTFLSKSKLVTEDDKKCVMLMFAGAALGGLLMLVRWLAR